MTLPHFSSRARETYSTERGTPGPILDKVRQIYGPITHDLASSEEFNAAVQAGAYWTSEYPCPEAPKIPGGSVVWCNPPGPVQAVRQFFKIWCGAVEEGATGAFLVFNLDHLRALQTPQDAYVWFPRMRLKFGGCAAQACFASALVLHACAAVEGLEWQGPLMYWGAR